MQNVKGQFYRWGVITRQVVIDHWGRWAVFGLAVLLWTQIAPAPARLIPEPPQTVQTQHPITCVHTRLDGEVTDLAIHRTLQMVREMGAPTIVELFLWAYLEPTEGGYDWHHADRAVEMAQQQGIKIIARIGFVPAWARPKPEIQRTSLNYLSPDYFDEYARFIGVFAARYRGKIDYLIPWNEPNLSFEWGYQGVSVETYVDLLRQVYTAAKAANPEILILGGALAPTLERSPNALDDLEYLRQMYAAGAAPYFDGLAVHTYGFTLPALDAPAPDRLNFRRFELLWGVMRDNGDGDKPVYITESSWNDHPRWIHAVKPGQRVKYTLEALEYAEQNWRTVQTLCFWYFRSPTLHHTYQDYFAFVTVEFRPRPIYDEVRAWARGE